MNQSRAKKIRKQIYGDLSKRIENYGIIERIKRVFIKDKEGKPQKVDKRTGQLVCTGLRAKYKQAKKAWKEGRRMPCSTI